ncbi:DoxX family membrane protein [Plantactinospora sp. ZYX-F-223]|uniref:DoxX family membrane protein n=1 Tax=Plantactinospora sp. ZYX-F-223 TaxID=3144103 RepID=UPI0031FD0368
MNVSHLPLRLAIGAFVLNSGVSKWNLQGEEAAGMHGMAVGAIPPIKRVPPEQFARLMAGTEVALGAALLLPVVPSALVGLGLLGFGGSLMRLYWATPGMHEPGSPRPTQQGVPIAKDSWLIGAGLTLLLDDLLDRAAGKRRGLGRQIARRCGKRRG